MQIENLSFDAMKDLVNNTPEGIHVYLQATDACDHYYLIENRNADESAGECRYFFVFYADCDDGELPSECSGHFTMIEAMIALSMRFVLDNCDTADTQVAELIAQHERYRGELQRLATRH